MHPFKPKFFNLRGKEYFSLQVGYESLRFYMVSYRTPGFATHAWKLQVYLLYSGSAQYYLFRKKDNRPPAGNKCVLWRADPIIAEPGPVNYTSWRSLFWVSSFFLVTRVPMEYSYTYGEI